MAKLAPSLLVATLTVTMTLVPAAPAAAQCASCLASSVDDLVLGTDEDKVIPVSFPSFSEARDCLHHQNSCSELEDVAYKDVDISDEMESYENSASFDVFNRQLSHTTLWVVCSYDESGSALDCWWDDRRDFGLEGELGPDARELRLVAVHSPVTEYRLDLQVN